MLREQAQPRHGYAQEPGHQIPEVATMEIYRHTQPGTLTRWSLGISITLLVMLLLLEPVKHVMPFLILAVLLTCLVLFHCLSVTVTADTVAIAFGPGLIRRTIPLRSIRAVRVVRNPWWYGWGIRLTLRGWLWNVSGLDAVELEFDDGTRFRIGTEQPQRLKEAIQQATRLGR